MAYKWASQQLALCADTFGIWSSCLTLRNSLINLGLHGLCIYGAVTTQTPALVLLQPLFVLAIDLTERFLGISPFSREENSIINYNRVRFFTPNPYGGGVDLGFNYYNGNYEKTAVQAQLDKFEYAFNKLGLKEGMRVLDCGCGMGDWLSWLKTEKKCEVAGINMTHAHVQVVRRRGIMCYHSDWQSLYTNEEVFAPLRGQFDAVTFWDTIEHYCKASEVTVYGGKGRKEGTVLGCEDGTSNGDIRIKTYGMMFKMAQDLLDPKSECGRVWTSCLHQTHSWKEESLYGLAQIYLMTSYYDGIYPFLKDGLSKYAPLGGFKLEYEEDRTEDYRMTSIINRDHFGYLLYSFQPCALLTSALYLLTDPHWLCTHIDLLRGVLGLETCWMWHMGGTVPHRPNPNAIAQLWWQVYGRA